MSFRPNAGKTRQATTDALNGDIDEVQPAVRRALFAISQELDEHAQASADRHTETMKSLSRIQALLITATLTFFTTLVTGVVGMILN